MTDAAPTSIDAPVAATPDRTELLGLLTEAILGVPGVVRLEPTLSTGGPAVLVNRKPSDGIRLLIRAGTAELDVNVATSSADQARATAHRIQAAATQVLEAHGYPRTPINVSVLAILVD